MAGALAAVRSLARSERISKELNGPSSELAPLEALLRMDVLHCREYRKAGKGLELKTWASLEAKALELEHLRATVKYEIRQIGARPWLLRTQETGIRKPLRELVLPDVLSIDLREAGAKEEPPTEWTEMPRRAAVTLALGGRDGRKHSFIVRR